MDSEKQKEGECSGEDGEETETKELAALEKGNKGDDLPKEDTTVGGGR